MAISTVFSLQPPQPPQGPVHSRSHAPSALWHSLKRMLAHKQPHHHRPPAPAAPHKGAVRNAPSESPRPQQPNQQPNQQQQQGAAPSTLTLQGAAQGVVTPGGSAAVTLPHQASLPHTLRSLNLTAPESRAYLGLAPLMTVTELLTLSALTCLTFLSLDGGRRMRLITHLLSLDHTCTLCLVSTTLPCMHLCIHLCMHVCIHVCMHLCIH